MLRANEDMVANSDKELGQTVKMRIDTGEHCLTIKLRLYRTLIHKKGLVEEAIMDMTEAGMIETDPHPPGVSPHCGGR